MSFMEDIKNQSQKYGANAGGGGGYFQFKKGTNRIRILAQPEVIAFHFFGQGNKPAICIGTDEGCPYHTEDYQKPTIKLATYILDRDDNDQIKLAELPLSLSYALNDLQQDSDFQFDDFPIPYDVKVTHDPDNDDPKAKYRLTPAPTREELPTEVQEGLDMKMKEMTPADYVEIRKNKQKGNTGEEQVEAKTSDENPNNIPF